MPRLILRLLSLALLFPAGAWSQASPDPGIDFGRISDIDRITRDRDAVKRAAGSLAKLELAYTSSGDLKSTLTKTSLQSVRILVEVNGKQIKKIAASKKPKLQESVQPGPLRVKALWSRPGSRMEAKCEANLDVGFKQVLFWPYGGDDGFTCEIIDLYLPDEVFQAWKGSLAQDQIPGFNHCATTTHRESAAFWKCIDGAGIPFPQR